jgi:hypothetical protein
MKSYVPLKINSGIFYDLAKAIMTYYDQNKVFMELKAKLGSGLNHILIAENKELKLNLLIQILTHIPTGAL